MKRMALSAMCVGLAALVGACSGTTSAGTDYTMTPLRELKATLDADIPTTHAAAVEALRDTLGYTIEHEQADALEGVVKARSATDREITVNTSKVDEDSTRVLIGVSPLGDEDIAREILIAIEDELD